MRTKKTVKATKSRQVKFFPLSVSVFCLLSISLGTHRTWGQVALAQESESGFILPDEKLPGDDSADDPSTDEAVFFRDPSPATAPADEATEVNLPPIQVERLPLELNRSRIDTGFSFRGGAGSADRFYDGLGGVPQPLLVDLQVPGGADDYKLHLGPVKLRFRVGTGVNVDHQSGDSRGTDTEGYLILGFGALLGDEEIGRVLQVDYDAAAKLGTRDDEVFHVDQSLALRGSLKFTKLRLEVGIYYASLSGVDREFSEGVNRDLVTLTTSAHYTATEKTSFDFDLAVPIQEYGEGLSSYGVTSTNYVNYSMTPKSLFGLGIAGGFVEVEGGASQTFEQALLRFISAPTAVLSYSATVGVDFRQTDDGLKVHPIFAVGGTWTPRDGTSLSLVAEQRVRNSVAIEDTDFTATSVTFGVAQRLGERFQVRPSVGYEFASYESIGESDSRFSDRDDQTFFAQVGVSAAVFQNCTISSAITYRNLDSTFSEQRNVQGSLQLTYHF